MICENKLSTFTVYSGNFGKMKPIDRLTNFHAKVSTFDLIRDEPFWTGIRQILSSYFGDGGRSELDKRQMLRLRLP